MSAQQHYITDQTPTVHTLTVDEDVEEQVDGRQRRLTWASYQEHLPGNQLCFDVEVEEEGETIREVVVPDLPPLTPEWIICSCHGCKIRDTSLEVLRCSNRACFRGLHFECYQIMCTKNLLLRLEDEKFACTKRCYDKIVRERLAAMQEKENASTLPWDQDGKQGREDPDNSMAVLLEWWTTFGNYSKYRGEKNMGKNKKDIYLMLSNKMGKVSRTTRPPKSVKCKITGIETNWKKAHDWAGDTGQGVKESEGIDSFEEGILRYCKYYYTLFPIMVDRCSSRPLASLEDMYFPEEAENVNESVDSDEVVSSGDDFEEERPGNSIDEECIEPPPQKKGKKEQVSHQQKKQICFIIWTRKQWACWTGGKILNIGN